MSKVTTRAVIVSLVLALGTAGCSGGSSAKAPTIPEVLVVKCAGDFAAHVEDARGFTRAGQDPPGRRRGHVARPAPGRAVGRYGGAVDPCATAADRADRESHQPADREKSRSCCARAQLDRSGAPPGSPCRTAVGAARAAAGHS